MLENRAPSHVSALQRYGLRCESTNLLNQARQPLQPPQTRRYTRGNSNNSYS